MLIRLFGHPILVWISRSSCSRAGVIPILILIFQVYCSVFHQKDTLAEAEGETGEAIALTRTHRSHKPMQKLPAAAGAEEE